MCAILCVLCTILYNLFVKHIHLYLGVAETCALINECASNNEILSIYLYHSILHSKHINVSVNVREV